ncbi:MAG: hypothetical protein CFE46_03830 [Burkholderiales bacterium PBB6]|nr:MAG: hypothetical protein CFE46_03830 [Burkholderiales bacterium PBB6]
MAFRTSSLLCAAAGLLLAGAAQAQSAGTLIGRISVTQIAPDVTSGDLSSPSFIGTKIDVNSNTQPTAGVTWMYTDNVSFDLPLALGFKHEIVGAGGIAGVGKIGEVKALPMTLLAQYRFFSPTDSIRPYVGLGPTYAKFYKARGTATLTGLTGGSPTTPTTLSMQSKLTVSAQVGVSVAIDKRWGIDAAMLYTPLKTRGTLSTGQTIDAKLNPLVYSVGVTYQY